MDGSSSKPYGKWHKAKTFSTLLGKDIQQAQHLHKYMTNDWLREIYKNIVGAVLLDFSAAFGIMENGKTCVMALHPLLYCG